jgi:hypothetical protein
MAIMRKGYQRALSELAIILVKAIKVLLMNVTYESRPKF